MASPRISPLGLPEDYELTSSGFGIIMGIMGPVFTSDKILEALKSSRLFSRFTRDQISCLISFSHVETYNKGDIIIHEQEINQKLFILLQGGVTVFAGDESIQTLRRKGDIIGEMSVITKSLTTASVIADTKTFLFTIPSQKIYTSGQAELQSLWYKLFSDILAERLARTTKKVIGFRETSARLHMSKKELIQKTIILESILGSMSDGVVVTGENGCLLHVNKAFTDLVGQTDLPAVYDLWPETIGMFKPDEKTLYTKADLPMEKAAQGILVDGEEIYISNPNLESGLWLQAGSRLLKTEKGDALDGSVVVFRNYTRTKATQEALIAARKNAEATAKTKSDFLSVMSHELHTPLNGILGMSSLLRMTRLTREQKDFVQAIEQSGQQLLKKIEDILYYNRFESGKIQLKSIEYVPEQVIEEIIKAHEPKAAEKQITITKDICRTARDPVIGDPEKLARIMNALVDNALKFTRQGTIHLTVETTHQDHERIEFSFSIRDTGIGMTEADMDKLSLPFAQADASLGRKFEGTGLGLAICRNLVEMMGGHIRVDSAPQKGACFTFSIVQHPLQKVVPHPKTNKQPEGKNPLKILVAEDNKVNQLLIKKVLTRLGYMPDVVENGVQAVQACSKKDYDVILMDIQMPEMDGLEASTNILETDPGRPKPTIIALTANTTDEIRDRCTAAGMSGFMTKPLDINRLGQILDSLSG